MKVLLWPAKVPFFSSIRRNKSLLFVGETRSSHCDYVCVCVELCVLNVCVMNVCVLNCVCVELCV